MTVYRKPTMTASEFKAAPMTLTVEHVSELAGVCPRTVQKLAQRGELPGVKVGNKWRFNKATIAALFGIEE